MPTHVGDSYSELRAALLVRTGMTGQGRSRALARLTDGWLTELATDAGVTVGGVALVAVGGYGRGELSPFSDVDLVLLHSSETPAGFAEMIAERLWYPIWDSRVKLDHAVRSVGGARQVARSDLADLLAILDIRHIAGDPELGVGLRRRVLADWRADAARRLPQLLEMCRSRWERSGDLAFATAGDLKSSRGGLRDLVAMRAVAGSWVADCPHQGLQEARGELLAIREALQLVTRRSTDRLQTQDQDGVADYLGLPDADELLRRVAAIGRTVGHAIDLTWPVLANLFLHYAFDAWMAREFPVVAFERYVDDVVVHATTFGQAEQLRSAIEARMVEVGLELHPDKTRILYCKDDNRRGHHEHESFTFLGYTFRTRSARNKHGRMFAAFLPAVSRRALVEMGRQVRRWRIHLRVGGNLADLARWVNPIVRGWMQYYGRFYRTMLHPLLLRINTYLVRWARKKYRTLHGFKKVKAWWQAVTARYPGGFAHWSWTRDFLPTGW